VLIDIASLRADLVRNDRPGLKILVNESAITFLDGERGILRYRGLF